MALDSFRKINITLNKANQHILEPQITKVGDVNGRELVVQLIDGGVIKDQTGVVLKLNWQHANGNQGSETFSPLDAKRGLFSVFYPENMLYRGTVTANISINENGKITNSLNFQIAVKGDVFDGSAVEVDGLLFTLKDLKDQLDERDSNLVDLENRQTSVESQFTNIQQEITDKDIISAPEIIAARGGLPQLDDRLAHMEIKVFNEEPSTSQLKEGEFGFVIDTAQQQYDDLNLSFERLNHLGFPVTFSTSPTGGGTKTVESHLSEIRSTDGTYRSVKVGQKGGVDGSSSYARLRTANIIPVDGSKKILKSDLTNFRFSVKPISANCYDGLGMHMASASVSFRGYSDEVLGTEVSNHFIYAKFNIPPNATGNKVVLDEWTVVKWDLQEACRKIGINFDLVAGVIVTFNAYTNHSTASCEYLVDDISFGV